jgi:hypothetical protein
MKGKPQVEISRIQDRQSMKLFAFYVGGSTANSNTEVHDVRFAVGESMEDCYDSLRRQWWGTPESLHIDCWADLTHADDHAIKLSSEPFARVNRLFFVNLGGYDPEQFAEIHSNVFVVAEDKDSAKNRALATVNRWMKPHRDTLFEVEQIIGLSEIAEKSGLHIHLTQVPSSPRFAFTTGLYIKLGV